MCTKTRSKPTPLLDRCPRCCVAGALADILPAETKQAAYKCNADNPCVWRKEATMDPADILRDHDMLVMACDDLLVALWVFESKRGGDPVIGPRFLKHRITRPTNPVIVHSDTIKILQEITERFAGSSRLPVEKVEPCRATMFMALSRWSWLRRLAKWVEGRG